ncbi:Angiopoietin-related protein 7 [Halotydeus destructor]|nr:Angiopoietin-related protein 7 [Halotydeus destructor]
MTSSSCSELYTLGGATCDGVYILFLNTRAFRAYCNMADTPGGWTVILRRGQFRANQRHRVSFDQPWDSYKGGLRTTLRVELESFDGDYLQLDYQLFRVDSEQNGYRLTVGDYRGPTEHAPVASSLINHNGSQFSATDKNLSYNVLENCPRTHRAGFWFEKLRCTYVLLTGTYYDEKELPPDGAHLGIRWVSWKDNEPLKAVQLKITTRP